MGVNKVILIGYAGQDPEVRYLDGGVCMARVRMATNEYFQSRNGERQKHTEWHTVVFWRRMAESVERFVHKGSHLYVEGRLRTRSWEDADKNTRYMTEIAADTFQILRSTGDRTGQQPEDANAKPTTSSQADDPAVNNIEPDLPEADDLPF